MAQSNLKSRFLSKVSEPMDAISFRALAATLASGGRKPGAEDRIDLAAALAHTAFLAPDRTAAMYDALAEGWRGEAISAAPLPPFDAPAEPVPDDLWEAYWSVIEDGLAGKLDALSITQRTAALGALMPEPFHLRLAEMSHLYPGVTKAAANDLPPHVKLETLAACPVGSLARQFHDLIVDNTFDLEVLDRAEIGLADLPAPLDYLNTRILQAHDLWHITAGYETTSLHEIAISAFQMGQFGHNYSAQFLSITAAIGALSPGYGYRVLMDTITSAWAHGRETPAMMTIPWEDVWEKSADAIRADYGIALYKRPYPANLIERSKPIVDVMNRLTGFVDTIVRPFRTAKA